MAKIANKTVKRAARKIIEIHYNKLSVNWDENKKAFNNKQSPLAKIPTKSLKNKIIGYTTRLMKRIQKGPVRGISLKLQEQERERRDNYVPDKSVFDVDKVKASVETLNMLKEIGFDF